MKSMKFGYLKNIKNILYIEAFIIMGTMFGLLYMAPLMVCCYLWLPNSSNFWKLSLDQESGMEQVLYS